MTDHESPYYQYLTQYRQKGLLRSLKPCQHPSAGMILVDEKSYVNFSTNDYLGLSRHPELVNRAQQWAETYGVGSAASRLVTGNIDLFDIVEAKIARLKSSETALIIASGFQANATILQALFDKATLGETPLVFSDRLNHASMHFGCAAANIRQIRYRHLDMSHLEHLLRKHENEAAQKFILTESVFSMDGDIAPMADIRNLADQFRCMVICDDAHATGVLGDRGTGLSGKADITIGTCSKALGSFGAFVTCSKVMRDYFINRCSGLIYSTALPPPLLGAIDAALDILPKLDREREEVANLAAHFRKLIETLGLDTGQSQTQIVPVVIGEAIQTVALSDRLKEEGFWASAIRPPTVPQNSARLRFSFCPQHSKKDIEKAAEIISHYSQF